MKSFTTLLSNKEQIEVVIYWSRVKSKITT
jgi:hypothetical protein